MFGIREGVDALDFVALPRVCRFRRIALVMLIAPEEEPARELVDVGGACMKPAPPP